MTLLLLDKGARQDIVDNENNFPIHIAFKTSVYMVKLLLRHPSVKNIVNNGNYRISDDDDLKNSDSKTPVNFTASRKRTMPCNDLPAKYRILEPINETNNNFKDRYKMLSGEPMFPLKNLENICKQPLINKSYFTDFLVYVCRQHISRTGEILTNDNPLDDEHPELSIFPSSNSSSASPESSISVCSFISIPASSNRYTPLVLNNSPRSAPATFIIPTHPIEAMQAFLANLFI